jgi:hypothetical protein
MTTFPLESARRKFSPERVVSVKSGACLDFAGALESLWQAERLRRIRPDSKKYKFFFICTVPDACDLATEKQD